MATLSISYNVPPANDEIMAINQSDGIFVTGDEVVRDAKCFLCDRNFEENENSWLLFQQRVDDDGVFECSLASILSSALGCNLDETATHSALLCDACNAVALKFEDLEQRFCELRYRILSAYNRTARLNKLEPITIEVNGVLETPEAELHENPQVQVITDINTDIIEDHSLPSNVTLNAVIAADDLVEEIFEEDYETLSNATDDPAKYAFALMNTTTQAVGHDESNVAIEMSNSLNFENAEHSLDAQGNAISYSEIMEQTSQTTSFNDSQDDNSVDSQTIHSFNNSKKAAYNMYVVDEYGDTNDSNETASDLQQALCEQNNDAYRCLVCNLDKQFDAKDFAKHLRLEHQLHFYACEHCSNGFVRRDEYNEHLRSEHGINDELSNESTAFECKVCQRVFTNQRHYRLHKPTHYNKQHECSECHKKFGSKNLLDDHMNMHTGQRPYKCKICDKDFASKYSHQSHMKIHTERQRSYLCNHCNKSFLNQQNLLQHQKLHDNVKAFVCDICAKAFNTQHNLDVHKIVHSGQRPFVCRMCGKGFARRAEIKDHERIHTGERPFKCDLCSLAFAQRSNLLSHKKSTHFNEKQHVCNQCDRSFKRRRLLDYHIQAVHTGERPFKCKICNAGFVYPEHYKKHMLIHSGHKPFACEVCGKKFNSRDNRNAHRFVHSDKKPYECLACGAGFMRKPMLLAHMKLTRHVNDTIIVNQPQIAGSTELKLDHNELENFDDETIVVEVDDKIDHIMQTAKSILTDDVVEHFADDAQMNGQLIKDELGDVKYLQFEDFDRDGQQTLTWVDIADDKD